MLPEIRRDFDSTIFRLKKAKCNTCVTYDTDSIDRKR